MKKEELEARILELSKAMEDTKANFNAIVGRIEEAKHMLSFLENAAVAIESVIPE